MSNLLNFIFCVFAFNSHTENPAFSFLIRDRCVEKVANMKHTFLQSAFYRFFYVILAIRNIEKSEEFFFLNMQL